MVRSGPGVNALICPLFRPPSGPLETSPVFVQQPCRGSEIYGQSFSHLHNFGRRNNDVFSPVLRRQSLQVVYWAHGFASDDPAALPRIATRITQKNRKTTDLTVLITRSRRLTISCAPNQPRTLVRISYASI